MVMVLDNAGLLWALRVIAITELSLKVQAEASTAQDTLVT